MVICNLKDKTHISSLSLCIILIMSPENLPFVVLDISRSTSSYEPPLVRLLDGLPARKEESNNV